MFRSFLDGKYLSIDGDVEVGYVDFAGDEFGEKEVTGLAEVSVTEDQVMDLGNYILNQV